MSRSYNQLARDVAEARSQGQYDKAHQYYLNALEMRPSNASLLSAYVQNCLEAGYAKLAIKGLERYLVLDPACPKAASLYIKLCASCGKPVSSNIAQKVLGSAIRSLIDRPLQGPRSVARRYLTSAANAGHSLAGLTRSQARKVRTVRLFLSSRQAERAEELTRSLVAEVGDHPAVLELRGQLAEQRSDHEEAISHYRKATESGFKSIPLIEKLLIAEVKTGRFVTATQRLEKLSAATRAEPDIAYAEALLLNELGKPEEALKVAQSIKSRGGVRHNVALLCARILSGLGNFDAANKWIEGVAAANPTSAEPYTLAALTRQLKPGTRMYLMAEKLANNAKASQDNRAGAAFALGMSLRSVGEHDAAFDRLEQGNALMDRLYDAALEEKFVEAQVKVFSSKLVRRHEDQARGEGIIFIMGLPRSGSTLLSQILASNPDVESVGEYQGINRCLREAFQAGYPERTEEFSNTFFEKLACMYLEELPERARGASFIIDKELLKFLHLGLVKLMFPGARFIHTCRDPMDVCFSIYSHRFGGNFPFAYRQETIAHFHHCHDRIMSHWYRIMPADIYKCQYETLVSNVEGEVRSLCQALGMSFDPSCLDFHVAKQAPHTSSVYQVRQKVYTSSVGAWQRHAGRLAVLREGLQKKRPQGAISVAESELFPREFAVEAEAAE